jgi:hypothetical protein
MERIEIALSHRGWAVAVYGVARNAPGGEGEVTQVALVDADYVGVPEGDVGQVFGYDFSDLAG